MAQDEKRFDGRKFEKVRKVYGRHISKYIERAQIGGGSGRMYGDDVPEIAFRLALLGLKLQEMATFFGIPRHRFAWWIDENPELLAAIGEGREIADAKVVHALFQRAVGFEKKVMKPVRDAEGNVSSVEMTEQLPPDTAAIKFWLTNRRPQDWKDRVEHTGKDGGPMQMQVVDYSGQMQTIEGGPAIEIVEPQGEVGEFMTECGQWGGREENPAPRAGGSCREAADGAEKEGAFDFESEVEDSFEAEAGAAGEVSAEAASPLASPFSALDAALAKGDS